MSLYFILIYSYAALPRPHITGPISCNNPASMLRIFHHCPLFPNPYPSLFPGLRTKKVLCVIKNKLSEERSMGIQQAHFTACEIVHEQYYKQMHVYFDDLITGGTEPRAHILTQSGSRICFVILVPQCIREQLGFCHTCTGSMHLHVWTSAREADSA